MSVFTRGREREWVNTSEDLLQSATRCLELLVLKLQGGRGEVKGESRTLAAGQANLFDFIKFVWKFLQFIYLVCLSLALKPWKCHTNITFVEQFQFTLIFSSASKGSYVTLERKALN